MSLLVNAQGINRSANFRFLQRLAVIFGFRRDCPRSPASCRDYRPRKWLPAETVRVILLPAEPLGRKLNHTDSLCRKIFTNHNSLGRKQEIADYQESESHDSLCRKPFFLDGSLGRKQEISDNLGGSQI